MRPRQFIHRRLFTVEMAARSLRPQPESPTVWYMVADARWQLWWPCQECGGASLPLHGRPKALESALDLEGFVAGLLHQRCPECETRRQRAAAAGHGPTVWYDTLLSDWVVRLTAEHDCEAILPLEIGWFDASEALVYRRASDIAYSGDAFDGSSALS